MIAVAATNGVARWPIPATCPAASSGSALEQTAEHRTPAERGERAAGHHHLVPAGPGGQVSRPAAQLHGDGHQEHADQRRDHRGVVAGEQLTLQQRERAEQDAEGGHQPDLVAEEERAEGGEGGPSLGVSAGAGEQQADAVVVAAEHQVAGEEEAEQRRTRRCPWRSPYRARAGSGRRSSSSVTSASERPRAGSAVPRAARLAISTQLVTARVSSSAVKPRKRREHHAAADRADRVVDLEQPVRRPGLPAALAGEPAEDGGDERQRQ